MKDVDFRDFLGRLFSCSSLAKTSEADASTAKSVSQRPPPRPTPEPQGRAAKIGTGRKLTIQTAHNLCGASVRIADFGLLMEFSFRLSDIGIRITSDLLEGDSWLLGPLKQ